MVFSSPILMNYNLFYDIRLKENFFTPKEAYIICKTMKVKTKISDIEVNDDLYIVYSFSYKEKELKERLLIKGSETVIEFSTLVENIEDFLDVFLPYFGVVHYGFLPSKKYTQGDTTRILSSLLNTNKDINYKLGEIISHKKGAAGLNLFTGGSGFYCFYHAFLKNTKIDKKEEFSQFEYLLEEWEDVVSGVEKFIKKNRIKFVLNQM